MAANGNGVQNPTAAPQTAVTDPSTLKGKGKAVAAEDDEMKDAGAPAHDDDDDDDDEDEDGAENDDDDDDDGEDDLQEIDLENVVGRRTRGRVIDFAKAAAEHPADDDEDDEDDDFEDPDTKMDEN